jgi:small conductance mechanosensitive channel
MSNVAAGLLLVMFRPYKIGDYVEVAGEEGVVEDLNIFTTTLITLDNVKVILSNSEVRGNTIKNFTSQPVRRVDVDFGIDYDDDMDKAIKIITQTAAKDSRVLTEPDAPWAKVSCLNDSSVDIQMRVWCKPDDYWDVRFDLIKAVKEAFDKGGISIPYPHVVEIEK